MKGITHEKTGSLALSQIHPQPEVVPIGKFDREVRHVYTELAMVSSSRRRRIFLSKIFVQCPSLAVNARGRKSR